MSRIRSGVNGELATTSHSHWQTVSSSGSSIAAVSASKWGMSRPLGHGVEQQPFDGLHGNDRLACSCARHSSWHFFTYCMTTCMVSPTLSHPAQHDHRLSARCQRLQCPSAVCSSKPLGQTTRRLSRCGLFPMPLMTVIHSPERSFDHGWVAHLECPVLCNGSGSGSAHPPPRSRCRAPMGCAQRSARRSFMVSSVPGCLHQSTFAMRQTAVLCTQRLACRIETTKNSDSNRCAPRGWSASRLRRP
jgi:hypothetical protein